MPQFSKSKKHDRYGQQRDGGETGRQEKKKQSIMKMLFQKHPTYSMVSRLVTWILFAWNCFANVSYSPTYSTIQYIYKNLTILSNLSVEMLKFIRRPTFIMNTQFHGRLTFAPIMINFNFSHSFIMYDNFQNQRNDFIYSYYSSLSTCVVNLIKFCKKWHKYGILAYTIFNELCKN